VVRAAIGIQQRGAVGGGARGNGPNAGVEAAVSVAGAGNVVGQLQVAVEAALCGRYDEGLAGTAEVAFHNLSPSAVVVHVDVVVEPTLRRFFALARISSARRLRAADD
jgi:hypothetical protein